MKYLFLFTIGPVQSFIAQARKTQDLAAGSALLSNLIWKAIRYLAEKENNQYTSLRADDLVFPSLTTLEKEPFVNLPNRFLAVIEVETISEIKKLGDGLKLYIETEFKEAATKQIVEKLSILGNTPIIKAIETQLNNTLDINWAAIAFSGNMGEYAKLHTKLEYLLAGVKNTRVFRQMPEKGRKCSVDGVNNIIVYQQSSENLPLWLGSDKISPEPIKLTMKISASINTRHISRGESLSAVSFYKRIYKEDTKGWERKKSLGGKEIILNNFPSTTEIATWNAITRLGDIYKDGNLLNDIEFIFKDTDEQFIFDENLTGQQLEGYPNKKERILTAQHSIMAKLNDANLKLSRYYAIILFDADKMGDIIKGKFWIKQEKALNFQKKLSAKLIEFAQFAKNYIDGNNGSYSKGRTVYAGGDDFLGFVDINYLYESLKILRQEFKKRVNDELASEKLFNEEFSEFTFSAGVVIAHYKLPLHAVLEQVRKSEKVAKSDDKGGRDAFCLTVMKRSGAINQCYLKWHFEQHYILDDLEWITQKLTEGILSPTFIRSLSNEFAPMMDNDGKITNKLYNSIEKESIRLIRRSCSGETIKNEAAAKIKNLLNAFVDNKKYCIQFGNLMHALNITEFIQGQINPVSK